MGMNVSNSFNPYEEWLGIDHKVTNYYQLIGLREFEPDLEKIRLAVTRAITRVRGYRPGQYAPQWAQLIDLLKRIQVELTDPTTKQAYDHSLGVDIVLQEKPDEHTSESVSSPAPMHQEQSPYVPIRAHSAMTSNDEGEETLELPVAAREGYADPMAPVDPVWLQDEASARTTDLDDGSKLQTTPVPPPVGEQWLPRVPAVKLQPKRSKLPIVLFGTVCIVVIVAVVVMVFKDQLGLFGKKQLTEGTGSSDSKAQDDSVDRQQIDTNPVLNPNNGLTSAPTSPDSSTADASSSDNHVTQSDDPSNGSESPSGEIPPDKSIESNPEETNPSATSPETTNPDTANPDPAPDATTDTSTTTTSQTTDDEPKASAEQLKSLSEALIAAKTALQTQDFATADKKLSEAEPFAKSEEHKAMLARLKKAEEYLREFRPAIDRAMQGLEAGVSFQVPGTSTTVAIVERRRDEIVVRVGGANKTYPLNNLPSRLGTVLADQGLQGSEDAPLIKGVFQALHNGATEENLAEVRGWWEKAGDKGTEMLPLLNDIGDYEVISQPHETKKPAKKSEEANELQVGSPARPLP